MAGVRRALIVATDNYADSGLSDLRAPEHDAAELAAVLRDPAIGDFDVATVLNQPHYLITEALAQFFVDANWQDVLVAHFTCHGVKADDGQLFFATTNSKLSILSATSIPSSFVHDVMQESRAGTILLMLDCCYSGAFAKGMTAKAGGPVDVDAQVGGTGRAVITASDDMQFAFEDGTLAQGDLDASPSVFTKYVVQGLRTGDADRDQDGRVTLTEFYGYVRDEVVRANPKQTPKLFVHDVDGNLFLANRPTPATRPTPLDEELQDSLNSPHYWVRLGAVEPLTAVLTGKHPGRALAARLALEEMCRDPDDRVKEAASEAMTAAGLLAAVDSGSDTETDGGAADPDTTDPDTTDPDTTDTDATDTDATDTDATDTDATDTDATDTDATDTDTTDTDTTDTETDTHGTHSVPLWRRLGPRTRIAGAAVALVVLLVAVAPIWWPNGGGEDDHPGGGTDGPLTGLESRFLLLTHENDSRIKELVSVDTESGEWEVVPDTAGKVLPTISPDRKWVVVMERQNANEIAHLVGPDDTERLLLDEEAGERCSDTNRPAWSPDGSRLALVCVSDSEPTALVIVDRDDGAIVDEILPADDLSGSPSWGDGFVYIARGEPGTTSLWAVPADGSGPGDGVEGLEPGSASQPDWSPHGLLYVIGPPGRGNVWVRAQDGTSDRLPTLGNADSPAWSPDGSSIAWLEGDGPKKSSLWMTTYPVGDRIEIPGLTGDLGPPAWGSR